MLPRQTHPNRGVNLSPFQRVWGPGVFGAWVASPSVRTAWLLMIRLPRTRHDIIGFVFNRSWQLSCHNGREKHVFFQQFQFSIFLDLAMLWCDTLLAVSAKTGLAAPKRGPKGLQFWMKSCAHFGLGCNGLIRGHLDSFLGTSGSSWIPFWVLLGYQDGLRISF